MSISVLEWYRGPCKLLPSPFLVQNAYSSAFLAHQDYYYPQYPITRSHLRQREMESYNTLNFSDNKIIFGNGLFLCHNK